LSRVYVFNVFLLLGKRFFIYGTKRRQYNAGRSKYHLRKFLTKMFGAAVDMT